jgi:hypothetical protein
MRKGNTVSAVTGIAVLVLGLMVVAAPAGAAGSSMPSASTTNAAAVYGRALIGGHAAAVTMVNSLLAMQVGIPIYAADRAAFQMARSPGNPYGFAPASAAGASTTQAAATYGYAMIGGHAAAVNMVNNLLAMHIGIPIYAAHRAAFQMSRGP